MYGLLSVHQNFMLAVGQHKEIKTVQYIIGSQLPSLCVDLDTMKQKVTVTKSNYTSLAGSFRLMKFIELDTISIKLTTEYDDSYIDLRENVGLPALTDSQKNLSQNIFLLQKLLEVLEPKLEFLGRNIQKGIDQKIKGIMAFRDFVALQQPNDKFINELVEIESMQTLGSQGVVQNFKKQFIRSLMNIDYNANTFKDVVRNISKEINAITPILSFGNERDSKLLLKQALSSLIMAQKETQHDRG
jgi:hypothetical protein